MADESDAPAFEAVRANKLHIASEEKVSVLPGKEAKLRVRYTTAEGTPLAERPVDFDLSDTLSGASLSPAQATTDDRGYVEASLHAGTDTAMFSVRVTAEGANEVSFEITVSDALAPSLLVGVDYDGARQVSSVSLTLVPDADCQKVAAMGSGVSGTSQVIYGLEEEVEFQLGAGRSYALIAGARDDTNAKLGAGCSDFMAPTTADAELAVVQLQVPIQDVKLELGQGYAITLGLDVQKPLALLAPAAASAVSAALPASSPTRAATFYLDAVQAQLEPAAAMQLRNTRGTLDPALQALLDNTQTGPLRLANELSGLVSALGGSCSIQASYAASGPVSFRVDRLFALPSPALDATAKQVELGAGALSGAAVLDASYDEASATLQIDSLSLALGLGSYASVLLEGARSDPGSFTARVGGVHGCASVGSIVAMNVPQVTAAVAVAACEQAAASLVDRIDAAWQALDAAHPSIWLSGPAAVHDRNDDGVVDDLGPAKLGGAWSASANGMAADQVTATLRVPAVTALVAL